MSNLVDRIFIPIQNDYFRTRFYPGHQTLIIFNLTIDKGDRTW
ncbi:hypothetical protein QUB36_29585 [Microcoleus sp. AT8-B1]